MVWSVLVAQVGFGGRPAVVVVVFVVDVAAAGRDQAAGGPAEHVGCAQLGDHRLVGSVGGDAPFEQSPVGGVGQ